MSPSSIISYLRNHTGIMLCLTFAAVVFAGLVFGCEEYNKTSSLLSPGKKVSQTELQGEVATEQATINKKQTAIATSQKSSASEYQMAIAAAQQKYAAELQSESDATDNLNTDAAAFNSKLQTAQTDLANKQAVLNNVVSVLSGVVGTIANGTFNPLSLATTIPTLAISALGIGAMADKSQLQGVVTTQRNTIAQVTTSLAAAATAPAPGTGVIVAPSTGPVPPPNTGVAGVITPATPFVLPVAA